MGDVTFTLQNIKFPANTELTKSTYPAKLQADIIK
jgi:hypothetical protein